MFHDLRGDLYHGMDDGKARKAGWVHAHETSSFPTFSMAYVRLRNHFGSLSRKKKNDLG